MNKTDYETSLDRTVFRKTWDFSENVRDFKENLARSEALLVNYRTCVPEESKGYPCMLTEGDKAVYYNAGRNFQGSGTIIDGGCFVGGTTHHLVRGLLDNPLFDKNDPRLKKIIKVFDLFIIDEDYILAHLKANFSHRHFETGGSFEPVFRNLMAEYSNYLDVYAGDVITTEYDFSEDIEVLGVDLCKALPVTDYVVRTMFPRVIKGGQIIQQDFIHEFHPHIHLSMLRLDDHFDLDVEMKWGGSVVYRVRKPITAQTVADRFGHDDAWFFERETNVRLLENLIERTFFDENKWVMWLTLGWYHHAAGDQAAAKEAYRKAVTNYPEFEPNDVTSKVLNG